MSENHGILVGEMMDDFFDSMDKITQLENEQKQLQKEKEEISRLLEENKIKQMEENEKMVQNGQFHYNRSKRQQIIEIASKQEMPKFMVQELSSMNEKCEEEKLTREQILILYEYESRFHIETTKKNSKVNMIGKIVSFLNGGGSEK